MIAATVSHRWIVAKLTNYAIEFVAAIVLVIVVAVSQ
jgi:hypothetical protein